MPFPSFFPSSVPSSLCSCTRAEYIHRYNTVVTVTYSCIVLGCFVALFHSLTHSLTTCCTLKNIISHNVLLPSVMHVAAPYLYIYVNILSRHYLSSIYLFIYHHLITTTTKTHYRQTQKESITISHRRNATSCYERRTVPSPSLLTPYTNPSGDCITCSLSLSSVMMWITSLMMHHIRN